MVDPKTNTNDKNKNIIWLEEARLKDLHLVGGKNASLGEMMRNITDVKIPDGFIVTTQSYDKFLQHNNLANLIAETLKKIDYDDLSTIQVAGSKIRTLIRTGVWPTDISDGIEKFYHLLSSGYEETETDVAVRSSGTAEDLAGASFAGQQDTYLNIRGSEKLKDAIKRCFASLYTDRAISYRSHLKGVLETNVPVKLSVCVQKMVRSDVGSAGVAFSLDTESGFKDIVLINGSWGLGELVVGGNVQPDEFIVFKTKLLQGFPAIIDKKIGSKKTKMIYAPTGLSSGTDVTTTSTIEVETRLKEQQNFCLSDKTVLQLANWVMKIEEYYTKLNNGKWHPVDVEWAYDGKLETLFIVQARPETVHSNKTDDHLFFETYTVTKDSTNINPILSGISVGSKAGLGNARIVRDIHNKSEFKAGDILVAEMTDPDWEPLMKIAAGIVTEKGGRTCHASIVARELGIPAVVGTENCCAILEDGQTVTVSCCEGETGFVYNGLCPIKVDRIDLTKLPKTKTKVMMNIGSPENAFKFAQLPHKGIGLAREEFIISNFIKVHPMALLNYDNLEDQKLKDTIDELTSGYTSCIEYYVDKLAYGISRIAAAYYPHDVVVRFSDFKTNEYVNLLGGYLYEPTEENPMIGWRGASRYYSDKFRDAFGLECIAIKKAREELGLTNIIVMIPFCRTVTECKLVLNTMKEYGLVRGKDGLKVYLMCEIPSNVLLADMFAKYVDGFSIGSNDLTQLILGCDRDSSLVAHIYDERDECVKMMIRRAIHVCHEMKIKIGICGQGPSDFPDFAEFLVEEGIDSISVTPDTLCKTLLTVASIEKKLGIMP